VGTSAEVWYFTDEIHGFFFIHGGPVLLGSSAAGLSSRGSTLFRVKDGRIETAIEDCAGSDLLIAVSDSIGFAAASSGRVEIAGRHRVGPHAAETYVPEERRILPPQILLGRFQAGN
jgi:hypothetical protein